MQDAPNSIPVQESPDLPPVIPQEPRKKSSKVWIIVLVVVLVLCCICLPLIGGAYWLYQNGDSLMQNGIPQGSLLFSIV